MRAQIAIVLTVLATSAHAVAGDVAGPGPAAADALMAKPAFDGSPGWLVIGESTSDAREAAVKAGDRLAQGIAVSRVASDLFQKLRKRLVVLVYGGFADRARAEALAAELGAKKIKVYVKNSGALATPAPKPPRLLRVWGRLDESIRFPTAVEISAENDPAAATVYTDRRGWYEAWLSLDGAKAGQVELCATAPAYSNRKASCTDATGGWFDVCGRAKYDARQHDVRADWSPTPDCNGE